jgi:hypothetical protein
VLKKKQTSVVAHTFNLSTKEAEAGGSLSLGLAWSAVRVPGWPGLHEETLSGRKEGKERKGKERKGKERKGKERKEGKERKGKERKGKERKGKERKGKERKGKERKVGLAGD